MRGLFDLLEPTRGLSFADAFRKLDACITVDVARAEPPPGQASSAMLSYRDVAQAKARALADLFGCPPAARRSDRSVDALLAHHSGARHYLDIRTMRLAKTRRCIVSDLFLPDDVGDESFIICAFAPHWSVTSDCGYFLIDEKKFLVLHGLDHSHMKKILIERLLLVRSIVHESHGTFLNKTSRKDLVFFEHFAPHFGHYFWNILPGWDEVVGHLRPGAINGVVWGDQIFGPRAFDLWPDRVAVPDTAFAEPGAAFERFAADAGLLPIGLGSDTISRDLARRVLDVAASDASGATRDWLARHAAAGRRIVALSIRVGNRKWESQEDGFVALARSIEDRFPGTAFVIDGMSGDTPKTQSHALMPFDEEIALSRRLQAAIEGFAPCLNLVGGAANDALHAAASCDYFFAPAGSGLVKFLWLANKPGLVFSNPEVLLGETAKARAVRVFEGFREGGTIARWLSPAKSVSLGNRSKRGNAAEDFDVDWQDLFAEAEPELRRLSAPRDPAGS